MLRNRVKSSHLKSVGYDPDTRTLEIEFKGGETYQYFGVPPQKFAAFSQAQSLGEYLAQRIKPEHRVRRIS